MKLCMLFVAVLGFSFSSHGSERLLESKIISLSKELIDTAKSDRISDEQLKNATVLLEQALRATEAPTYHEDCISLLKVGDRAEMREIHKICVAVKNKNYAGLPSYKKISYSDTTVEGFYDVEQTKKAFYTTTTGILEIFHPNGVLAYSNARKGRTYAMYSDGTPAFGESPGNWIRNIR